MLHRSSPDSSKKKDSKSFYTSLLLSFLGVSVTSILLLAFVLTGSFLDSAVKSTNTYNQQLLSQTNYAIDEMNENRMTILNAWLFLFWVM